MRYLFLVILFILCLALGFQAGMEFNNSRVESLGPTPSFSISPTISPPLTEQKNYLVIGVDRIGSPEAHLLSAWMLIEVPGNRYIFLPVFPINDETNQEKNTELAAAFSVTREGVISPAFWNLLQERQLWWHQYAVIDEIAMMQFVDFFEDLTSEPSTDNGSQLVGKMPSWKTAPAEASRYQAQLIHLFCRTSKKIKPDTSLTSILELIPDHAYTNLVTLEIISIWEKILAAKDGVLCEFPAHPEISP